MRLRAAIAAYQAQHRARADTFTVRWTPFYLDVRQAGGARAPAIDKREAFVRKHGEERAPELYERIASTGALVGIDFRFGGRTGGSRDAHRLVDLAGRKGGPEVQWKVVDRLFQACHEEERDVSDVAVLLDVAREVGLDEREVRDCLESEEIAKAVDDEAMKARENGITGVPHFSINNRFDITGAQESLAFVKLFERLVKLEERDRAKV